MSTDLEQTIDDIARRARAASDVLADAPNAAVLALRIASNPHAEEERRRNIVAS